MNLSQIYQDQSLVGHALISLPSKIWNFSQDEFCLYPRGPVVHTLEQTFYSKRVSYLQKDGSWLDRGEIIFLTPVEDLLADVTEFVGRRILGSFVAAISFVVLIPIGFTAKVLHLSARSIVAYLASTALGEKIRKIWNNADLVGHALTSAPAHYYQLAFSPLSWHLNANGKDRRTYIAVVRRGEGLVVEQKAEYQFVPFEAFEIIYRGAMLLGSTAASPLGLAAKSVHLLGRSLFGRTPS